MSIQVKNIAFIRSHDEFGTRVAEALESIASQAANGQQQTNANPTGQPNAPPQVHGVNVSEANGFMHVSIKDENPIYRGIRYYVEHADNPQFKNPQVVALHDARATLPIAIGNQTRYVRAYSAYSSSPPSPPVYHGSASQPRAVTGSGANTGPIFLPSQGSGTGQAGTGLEGPGKQPFRPVAGGPPVR